MYESQMICTTYLDKIVGKVSCFTGNLIQLVWVHDLGIVYGLMTFPALGPTFVVEPF